MKNNVLVVIIGTLLLVACNSREDKIADLIKSDIISDLQNPDSYSPVYTRVEIWEHNKYGDTIIIDNLEQSIRLKKRFDIAKDSLTIIKDKIENLLQLKMDFAVQDSLNIASKLYDEYLKELRNYYDKILLLASESRERKKVCDKELLGWMIQHRFVYESKENGLTESIRVYFVDFDYNRIIRVVKPYDDLWNYEDEIDTFLGLK